MLVHPGKRYFPLLNDILFEQRVESLKPDTATHATMHTFRIVRSLRAIPAAGSRRASVAQGFIRRDPQHVTLQIARNHRSQGLMIGSFVLVTR